jgi:hypothetical protein
MIKQRPQSIGMFLWTWRDSNPRLLQLRELKYRGKRENSRLLRTILPKTNTLFQQNCTRIVTVLYPPMKYRKATQSSVKRGKIVSLNQQRLMQKVSSQTYILTVSYPERSQPSIRNDPTLCVAPIIPTHACQDDTRVFYSFSYTLPFIYFLPIHPTILLISLIRASFRWN